MGHRIFISYRRIDSIHESGRIYDRLVGALGENVVFRDVDAIPLGVDFRKVLDEEVSVSDILLAIIGDDWVGVQDEHGNRRLENPNDFVRIEIESAIKRKIHVIPVFVGRATGLPTDKLPDTMRELAFFNGTPVRADPDFHNDVDKLIRAVNHIFKEVDERRMSNAVTLKKLAEEWDAFNQRISALTDLKVTEKGQRTRLQKRIQAEQDRVDALLADEPGMGRELEEISFRQAIDAFEEDIVELEAKIEERQSAEQRERVTQEERDAERKREEQATADHRAAEQVAAADRLTAEQAAAAKSEAEAKRQRTQHKEQNESSLRGLIDDTEALQKKLTTLTNLSDVESEEKESIAARLETLLAEFNHLLEDEASLSEVLDTSDFQQRIDRLTQAVTTLQEERRERLRTEKEEAERSEREQREAERIRKSLTRQRTDMQKMLDLLNGGIGLDDLEVVFQEGGANLLDRVQTLLTQLDDALEALPPRVDDATTIEDYQQSLSVLRAEVESWHREVRATQPRNWTWAYVVGGIAAVALIVWGVSQTDFSAVKPQPTNVAEVLVEPSTTPEADEADTFDPWPEVSNRTPTLSVPTQSWQEVARFNERGVIQDIALSPDETLLAVASSTGLWLYEYPSMRLLVSYDPKASISSVAWAPDGSRVVLGGNENKVYIWDVGLQQEILVFEEHESEVRSVDWSSDGSRIASGDDYGRLYVWSPDSGAIEYALEGHDDMIWDVEFSTDKDLLASASEDYTVHVWDLTSGDYITVFEQHLSPVNALAWSPDGKRLATGNNGEDTADIYVWDMETGEVEVSFLGVHNWQVSHLIWSPAGDMLVSGSRADWTIRFWNIATQSEITVAYPNSGISGLAWSISSNQILSGGSVGTIEAVDLETYVSETLLLEHVGRINGLAVSPDETQFLASLYNNYLGVMETESGQESFTLEGHEGSVWDAAWSPDNSLIATAGGWQDYVVRIWDAVDGAEVAVLEGHTDELRTLSWSPDGTMLASGGLDGTIRIWNAYSFTQIKLFEQTGQVIYDLAWSPDGQFLVSASSESIVYVYDVVSETLAFSFSGHAGGVRALALSPDGQMLATGGEQSAIFIFDITSGERVARLVGQGAWVYSIDWSPDGAYLVTGGGKPEIDIWDMTTFKVVDTLVGHTEEIQRVIWAIDGTLIYSAGHDGTVRIWKLIE